MSGYQIVIEVVRFFSLHELWCFEVDDCGVVEWYDSEVRWILRSVRL